MNNSNSAVERVKNHLAYKLGQAIINFSHKGEYHNIRGYIVLFKKLYQINKQHKKEQAIYQQTIQVFPQLKYPSLEKCSDYEQALRCKFHLSYMLGELFIQTFQTLHKGSIFRLGKNIKKINEEFEIFRELFDQFKIYNVKSSKYFTKNKSFFLDIGLRIKNLLKIHKDYKPIIENIFRNFNYFVQNFDTIEEWLLSDDFNKRYKTKNHSYPSLLNPEKLNDKNKKINYENISPELAWDINLPLPDNYEFVFLLVHGAGTTAMTRYLRLCNINVNRHWGDPLFQYLDSYRILVSNPKAYNAIILGGCLNKHNFDFGIKFYNLIQKKIPAICIVRDPISVLRPIVNHYGNLKHPKDKICNHINIDNHPVEKIFQIQVPYAYPDENGNPTLNTIKEYADDKYGNFYILNIKIKELQNVIKEVYYLDMIDILPKNSFKTLNWLSKKLHFDSPQSSALFSAKLNSSDNHVDLLFFPKTFYIECEGNKIEFEVTKCKLSLDKYLDYTRYFTNSSFMLQD
ncbi:capsular biosynthesis protein, partial [Campylobacter coli]|nr:capsular biosynthesis protein [Campylobacter coli]